MAFLWQVRARREVILCTGTIGSPQLLLLSGIGEKSHLEELGIPLLHHLPGKITDSYKIKYPVFTASIYVKESQELICC